MYYIKGIHILKSKTCTDAKSKYLSFAFFTNLVGGCPKTRNVISGGSKGAFMFMSKYKH